MKHIAFKSALIHFSATLLLFMGAVPANAQYYMNVFRKNGTKVEYLVSDLDSVTFTSAATPVIPVNKKDVSKISRTYVQNYPSDAILPSLFYTLGYDNSNRVTSVTGVGSTTKLDYSNDRSIIVTAPDDTATYNLDANGYVSSLTGYGRNNSTITVEREGEYSSALMPFLSFTHQNGVVTSLTSVPEGKSVDMTYRFNYVTPAINIDLNWFIISESGFFAPMWLGYCGKMNDKLFEFPVFSHQLEKTIPILSEDNKPEGTYHYENKYNHFTNSVRNMSVTNDNDGYPIGISYSVDIEEYIYSFDYVLDIDTIILNPGPGTKGENERYVTRTEIIKGSEKDEPTGRIVGTNEIIYSIEYRK